MLLACMGVCVRASCLLSQEKIMMGIDQPKTRIYWTKGCGD